uniref:Tyrosine-protein phosphatase domain-containing protein n=1 Tax=Heterorhabditis bacteriophora TaxID=37862 RepID=A0A1I7XAG6_HETBA
MSGPSRQHLDESVFSDKSSVEFQDAIIDETWFDMATERRADENFGRLKDRKHDEARYEDVELKTFIAQKLFKVDGILCDEQTRLSVIKQMIVNANNFTVDDEELTRKYGVEMSEWLRDRLVPSVADCSGLLLKATSEFNRLKNVDPLCNWFRQSPEVSAQIASRISRFAEQMASRVKWSFLYCLLDSVVPCGDATRVKLHDGKATQLSRATLLEEIFDGDINTDYSGNEMYGTSDFIHANYVRGGALLNAFICTQAPMKNTQTDFWRMIYQERSHMIVMLCSAVDTELLGPLDRAKSAHCPYYWPRSLLFHAIYLYLEYFLHFTYYIISYHRSAGAFLRFGSLIVRNIRVDGMADPLFNVSHLVSCIIEIHPTDSNDEADVLRLEHWQWDWQYMGDVHWPFRILRRARLSRTPTVVHCLDGCGRSGTLVAIETVIMQFLRGAPLDDDTVLLSSVFVRLQRRMAISSPLHYLFIYRTILHWVEPYVTSIYQRIALGLTLDGVGFVPKYESMIKEYAHISPPY